MPIDGIGKPGAPSAPPPAGGAGAPSRPSEASTPFTVGGARVDAPAHVEAAAPGSPLARLEAGEIDLSGYLDARVDEATTHLRGLPEGELEAIRAHLRDRMASDPVLVDLVTRATGKTPEPPRE